MRQGVSKVESEGVSEAGSKRQESEAGSEGGYE